MAKRKKQRKLKGYGHKKRCGCPFCVHKKRDPISGKMIGITQKKKKKSFWDRLFG